MEQNSSGPGPCLPTPVDKRSNRYSEAANHHRSQAPTYGVGQKLWLSTQDLPLRTEARKLAPRFVGPFEILKIINPVAVRLKLPRSMPIHPMLHVSRIKQSVLFVLPQPLHHHPASLMEVLQSLANAFCALDAEGEVSSTRLWVPVHHILDSSLIRDFHQRHPSQSSKPLVPGNKKSGRGSSRGMASSTRRAGSESPEY